MRSTPEKGLILSFTLGLPCWLPRGTSGSHGQARWSGEELCRVCVYLPSGQSCSHVKPILMPAWNPSSRLHTAGLSLWWLCPLLFRGPELSDLEVSWGGPKADHLEETTESFKLELRNFPRSSIMSLFFPNSESQPASHLPAHTLSHPPSLLLAFL